MAQPRFDREAVHENVDRAMEDAIDHLAEHFSELGRARAAELLREEYASLESDAHVHQHLVTLAEHAAWKRLQALRDGRAASA